MSNDANSTADTTMSNASPCWDFTATYSPDDNKLRLYSLRRLDAETYAKAKELGFKWAPKQELFVAPAWTPAREDFLLELCGEISDEDKSLVERAEERADRFEDYSIKRAREADRAHADVKSTADNIPFGQPILVGHHSERRARKDAKKIENGMRRAVSLFEASEYWTQRAAGAVRNAKYKERADVRYRRMKGIEADKRKTAKSLALAEKFIAAWRADGLTRERALQIANYDHISKCFTLAEYPRNPPASQYEGYMGLYSALTDGIINAEQAREIALRVHARSIAGWKRWIAHFDNRIAYERAMLDESGGLAVDRFDFVIGGQALVRDQWATIIRVTRKNGHIVSVTTNARYCRVCGVEEVKDYKAPTAEQKAAVEIALKLPPIANYPGEGFVEITQEQWDRIPKDYKGFEVIKTSESYEKHRTRHAIGVYLLKGETDSNKRHHYYSVFISDAKCKDPPAAPKVEATHAEPAIPAPRPAIVVTRAASQHTEQGKFDHLKNILNSGGLQVVSAPQLFPTPPGLAQRMVEMAGIKPGERVLEPHVGTMRILLAISAALDLETIDLTTVEINYQLSQLVRAQCPDHKHFSADFLGLGSDELGGFDVVLMNPPFANAEDILHIKKGLSLLNEGGRLVAICANGPRQQAALKPLVAACGGLWEDLPANTFKESGTGVNTALLVFEKV
jgi:hypothetical protein